jgi:hypothetical protein
MPLPKDPIKAEATRRKMSESAKGRKRSPPSEVTRRKISESEKGKKVSEETRRRISDAGRGKKQSPETIAKRVEKLKGKKHPPRSAISLINYSESSKKTWENPEYRKRMSEVHTGKKQSPETIAKRVSKITGQQRVARRNCIICGKEFCRKGKKNETAKFCSFSCKGQWMSKNSIGEKGAHWQGGGITKKCKECGKEFRVEKNQDQRARFCSLSCKGVWSSKNLVGENNPNWTGGYKDYCEKWNLEFRRRIRSFFDYKCAECGTPQNKKLLHCHHVYYDKKSCCSVNENGIYFSNLGIKGQPSSFEIIGDPNKFITLCDSCHSKSSGKKMREYWARHFEAIINNYYLGRSYLTKEEYEKIR